MVKTKVIVLLRCMKQRRKITTNENSLYSSNQDNMPVWSWDFMLLSLRTVSRAKRDWASKCSGCEARLACNYNYPKLCFAISYAIGSTCIHLRQSLLIIVTADAVPMIAKRPMLAEALASRIAVLLTFAYTLVIGTFGTRLVHVKHDDQQKYHQATLSNAEIVNCNNVFT